MKLSKIMCYLGWESGFIGGLMMLACVIGFLTGGEFLGVRYYFNFFFYSIPFMLMGIFLIVATKTCCCCTDEKCCTEEEKK